MFAYCNNSPINLYDPLGHWAWPTWEEVEEWLEEAVDTYVQTTVEALNPLGTLVYKRLHYNRNSLNKAPTTEEDANNQGYTLLDENNDKFHQNNLSGGRNRKYISPDGHHEVVFYHNGQLNNTPEDEGTYNVGSATGGFFERYIVHGILDVLPYLIWGNSPDDSTTIIDRIELSCR